MAAIKLKVGDRVRLYRKDAGTNMEVADIGVVTNNWCGLEKSYHPGRIPVLIEGTSKWRLPKMSCLAHA